MNWRARSALSSVPSASVVRELQNRRQRGELLRLLLHVVVTASDNVVLLIGINGHTDIRTGFSTQPRP
jgi:hypothetical protein